MLGEFGRVRQSGTHDHPGDRRHRRPGGGRIEGRGPGQPVPGHIRRTDAIGASRWCAASTNAEHHPCRDESIDPAARHARSHRDRAADAGRPREAWSAGHRSTPSRPRAATRPPSSKAEVAFMEKLLRDGAWQEGKPAPHRRDAAEEEWVRSCSDFAADHRQAGPLRVQCRRGRASPTDNEHVAGVRDRRTRSARGRRRRESCPPASRHELAELGSPARTAEAFLEDLGPWRSPVWTVLIQAGHASCWN